MLFTKPVQLGAAVIMAAGHATALIRRGYIGPLTDSYTSSLSPNITVHGTTYLIVSTGSNATFTILEPSFTGEPDREALAIVTVSAVTSAVLGPIQKHHGVHIHREITTVTEIEGYGALPLATSSSTSTKKTDAIGTTGTHTTHGITPTSSLSVTTEAANTTSSSVSRPGVVVSAIPAGLTSSNSLSPTTPSPTSSVSILPGLTVPPTEIETAPVTTPTSVHRSGSVHSVSRSQDLFVVIMGASMFSIALAFVVAA